MISTHILDTSLGNPASDVEVKLEKQNGSQWITLTSEKTNKDGRIVFSTPAEAGTYRLEFQIEPYFKRNKLSSFFPEATVVFSISDVNRKYHVPLLLNPYGYSTYRGS
jgi:5-hydroxyisourate hydrolase